MFPRAEDQQKWAVQVLCMCCAREFMCFSQLHPSRKLYLIAADQLLSQIRGDDHSEPEFLYFHHRNNSNLLNC